MTEVLRSTGVLGGSRADAVTATGLGGGTGFMSVLARLDLAFEVPGGGPRTLIAKFTASHPGAKRMDAAFGHYEREHRYYAELAAADDAWATRCLFNAFEPSSRDGLLLLEDLAPRRTGDQLAGLRRDQAAAAVEAVAGLHARWWRSASLDRLTWLDRSPDAMAAACQELWPAYAEFAGAVLSADAKRLGARLAECVGALSSAAMARPRALIHGDFRADNLMFGPGGPRFVDWQLVGAAPAAFDVAFLLTSSLDTATRRASEDGLLGLYHRALLRHGVAGYTLADCRADYRLGALLSWCWPIVGVGMLDLGDQRGEAMFRTWAARMSAAVDDLDLAGLVR